MKESVRFKPETPVTKKMPQISKFAELSDELLCVLGAEGKFHYVNPAFMRLFSRPVCRGV